MIDVDYELNALAEDGYAEFTKGLNPGIRGVIGVRLPALRLLAKRIAKDDWKAYLSTWQYRYLEDAMLRAFVISYVKVPLEERFSLFSDFIPYIDNWSVCDSFSATWKPKEKEKDAVWEFILPYLGTNDEFRMRYCTVMMVDHFVDEEHLDDIIRSIDSAKNDGYYFKMAAAWAISVCFVKFPERVMPYLEGKNSLDDFTYNKSLQKIIESYRASDEMKERIRAMKRQIRK